jgi:hypothetical protein
MPHARTRKGRRRPPAPTAPNPIHAAISRTRELVESARSLPPRPEPTDPNPPPLQVWNGDDFRNDGTYPFELPTRPGKVFILRRVDAFDLFMNNVISTPLLSTVNDLDHLRTSINNDKDWMAKITPDKRAQLMTTMREWAKKIVVYPVLVEDATDTNPDHLQIGLLTFKDLTALLYAAPDKAARGRLSEVDAQRFRRASPPADGTVAHDGEAIRPTPERVSDDTEPAFFGA